MTIISYNRNFAFIHIQKCGGTSIEVEYQKYVKWGDFVVGSTVEGEAIQKPFQTLYGIEKHTPAKVLARIVGEKILANMITLAIVREPLKIIESDYKFAFAEYDRLINALAASAGDKFKAAAQIRAAILERDHPAIPNWWYHHHEGSVIDALLSNSFEEYLQRVADNRWQGMLARYVLDDQSRKLVKYVLKLEDPESLLRFFREVLGLKDFTLRRENKGNDMSVTWPPAMRRRFKAICAEDDQLFGY